ncbi:hypothetical protein KPSB59_1290019 [Klebsiella quasipneumoniae subsp. quasipneumoniae]|nr:hypothetical protein KPSB59_1290019 [Klebsiella quasipneumoniae subsp. quasipneumoniae]CDN06266.1 hypothetical protein SB30_190167 [Klebsiella quasipneumoniae subsp. similipneumoniae]CDQ14140.1 hypothetical protein KQQSB11_260184 [Klebsiella quasipneumoniae subsp. quasipneumoniae]
MASEEHAFCQPLDNVALARSN